MNQAVKLMTVAALVIGVATVAEAKVDARAKAKAKAAKSVAEGKKTQAKAKKAVADAAKKYPESRYLQSCYDYLKDVQFHLDNANTLIGLANAETNDTKATNLYNQGGSAAKNGTKSAYKTILKKIRLMRGEAKKK